MLRKISIVIMCLTLIGCYAKYVPEREMLNIIEQSPVDGKKQICIYKSVQYAYFLNNNGYDALITVGGVVDLERPHARVIVTNPKTGGKHMIDPTWIGAPTDGLKITQYNNFTIWVIFEKGAEYDDVMRYKRIQTIYRLC